MKSKLPLIGALLATLALGACGSDGDTTDPIPDPTPDMGMGTGTMNLVELAQADGRFTTLLDLAAQANLAMTLETSGPFTIFAPTDEAFAALPAGTLDGLTPTDIAGILTFHAVTGNIPSTDITDGGTLTSLAMGTLTFAVADDGGVTVNGANNGANVIETDLMASNGTVHVIDAVLLPPTP